MTPEQPESDEQDGQAASGSPRTDEQDGRAASGSPAAGEPPDEPSSGADADEPSSGADAGDATPTRESSVADADETLDVDAMGDRLVDELPETTPSSDRKGSLPVSVDDLFAVLSAPGNRFVLTYLLRVENPASYDDLVEYVVRRATTPPDLSDAKYRGRVAARLVHANLPELAAAGLLEHDPAEQTISSTPAIDAVAPYLALAISQTRADGVAESEGERPD